MVMVKATGAIPGQIPGTAALTRWAEDEDHEETKKEPSGTWVGTKRK